MFRLEFDYDYYKLFNATDFPKDENIENGTILTSTSGTEDGKESVVKSIFESENRFASFKKTNLKLHFLSGDLTKLLSKKKFDKAFDFVHFGFHSKNCIDILEKNLKSTKYSKVHYEMP